MIIQLHDYPTTYMTIQQHDSLLNDYITTWNK
jgi:hypothetical protein